MMWTDSRILLNTELQTASVKQPEFANKTNLFFSVIHVDYLVTSSIRTKKAIGCSSLFT